MLRIHPVADFSEFGRLVVFDEVEACQDLAHELAFVVEYVEVLRLITVCE